METGERWIEMTGNVMRSFFVAEREWGPHGADGVNGVNGVAAALSSGLWEGWRVGRGLPCVGKTYRATDAISSQESI